MARRSAREAAMSLLYQRNYIQDYDLNALGDMVEEWDLDDKDIPYIDDILTGSLRHINEIDDLIRNNAKGWKFERISKVDLSILRLALYEILYRDDIPESVSINEAVELAKKYGSEKTGSFVNGILGTVVRSQENSSDT
ncbi:MAG TPA: transcription antitermination factor NusB [Clostridiales bacterium]|nr:transcription antitermination factor NusB [Clostridiales bacterium]